MITLVVVLFILGYAAIILEHPIRVNKTASALITGVLCWTAIQVFGEHSGHGNSGLSHHLSSLAEILFFLLGAMTIVELIDIHEGFSVVTKLVKTKDSVKLLWIVGVLTFFLSAVLDNLTTTIVMITVTRKLLQNPKTRMLFAGFIVIAANAGGAWSPIGDVTTTMLWIGGQISALNIVLMLFVPSVVCLILPGLILARKVKGEAIHTFREHEKHPHANLMLIAGVAALLFVPIFKTLTGLPPYMGMMLALGLIWILSEMLHHKKDDEIRKKHSVASALSRIDSTSILFFLGILLAVGSLEETGVLNSLAQTLDHSIGNNSLIVLSIGLSSAVIDNVPLVAACMGMYPLASPTVNPEVFAQLQQGISAEHGMLMFSGVKYYLQDASLWEFLAYCAGTGGSCLVFGSAAGVAAMGMEKLSFFWYLKNISFAALIGYLAGAGVFLLMN